MSKRQKISLCYRVVITVLFSIKVLNSFSQDTTFYENNTIRSILSRDSASVYYLLFLDRQGNNILTGPAVYYHYYDSALSTETYYKIKNKHLVESYFILSDKNNYDTVYIYCSKCSSQIGPKLDSLFDFLRKNYRPREPYEKKSWEKRAARFIVNKKGEITNIKRETNSNTAMPDEMVKTLNRYKMFGIIFYNNQPVNHHIEITGL